MMVSGVEAGRNAIHVPAVELQAVIFPIPHHLYHQLATVLDHRSVGIK